MAPFTASEIAPDFKELLKIRGARNRNLRSINLDIPLNSFVCLTGVSGSGKSSLLSEVIESAWEVYQGATPDPQRITAEVSGFEHLKQVLLVDQSPLSKTPRANIATYTKIWDRIRELLSSSEGER